MRSASGFVPQIIFVIKQLACRTRPGLPPLSCRAAMALAGANLLARRCSLWRSACRPLMLAAMGQPRVTQDPSRNGQVTIEPADAAHHSATFVGPIHGLGDTNQGWLGAAMHLHAQMPHVKFVLPNAPTMPVRSTWLGSGSGWVRVKATRQLVAVQEALPQRRAAPSTAASRPPVSWPTLPQPTLTR